MKKKEKIFKAILKRYVKEYIKTFDTSKTYRNDYTIIKTSYLTKICCTGCAKQVSSKKYTQHISSCLKPKND